jgi:hypothetical protein
MKVSQLMVNLQQVDKWEEKNVEKSSEFLVFLPQFYIIISKTVNDNFHKVNKQAEHP